MIRKLKISLFLMVSFCLVSNLCSQNESLINDSFIGQNITKEKQILKQQLKIAIDKNDYKQISDSYYKLSWIYDKESSKIKALSNNQKALDYSRKGNYKEGECRALQHLALILMRQKKQNHIDTTNTLHLEARVNEHLLDAKRIAESLNDTTLLGQVTINMGNFELQQKNYSKALELYKTGIIYGKAILDTSKIIIPLSNISSIHQLLKDYPQSLKYSKEALRYLRTNDNKKALIYNSLGLSYYMLNQDDTALMYLKKGEKYSISENNNKAKLKAFENLANLYYFTNEYKKSAEYYYDFIELNDSFNNTKINNQFLRMQEEFKSREAEVEIKEAKQNAKLANRTTNATILALILLLIIGVVIFSNLNQKRKLAQNQQHLTLVKMESILKNQETQSYEAMIEGQDYERKRISEDLHDRLGSTLSTVKLYFTALEDEITNPQGKEKYTKAISLLDKGVNEIRTISKNISSNTLNKFGLLTATKELVQTLNKSGKISINIVESGMDERIDNLVEINIYRILQEIINNILKHADASKIDVNFTMVDNDFIMIIEDNGKGFVLEEVMNGKTKKGNGISNINNRLEKINGTINFDSYPQKGTTVIVNVQLNRYA